MVILHFTADWCKPCQQIKPIVASFINGNPDIEYNVIDVDHYPEMAKELSVLSVPTLLFTNENHVVKYRHVGLITIDQLKEYTK